MSKAKGKEVDLKEAESFLADHLGIAAPQVEFAGEGAWSRCFGFQKDDQDLVIRFGSHVDDFEKDALAFRHHTPELVIPQVLEIGQAFDGYYAISTRVCGVPLESLTAAEWLAVVPSLVSVMEAMRTADLSSFEGFGGWEKDGNAAQTSWSGHLLKVGFDNPNLRTYGWRKKLATSPEGEAAFAWGFDLLQQVFTDAIPRSLLHCDLMNKNVLVVDGKISGVFDWGCSLYGDHLYDLALLDFWAPWYPELDISFLRRELEQHWRAVGYEPEDKEARLTACYLHIGLDHLGYHAYLGNWEHLSELAEQMHAVVDGLI